MLQVFLFFVLVVFHAQTLELECGLGERMFCACEKITDEINIFTNFYRNHKDTSKFFDSVTFGINLAKQLNLDPCTPIKYRY